MSYHILYVPQLPPCSIVRKKLNYLLLSVSCLNRGFSTIVRLKRSRYPRTTALISTSGEQLVNPKSFLIEVNLPVLQSIPTERGRNSCILRVATGPEPCSWSYTAKLREKMQGYQLGKKLRHNSEEPVYIIHRLRTNPSHLSITFNDAKDLMRNLMNIHLLDKKMFTIFAPRSTSWAWAILCDPIELNITVSLSNKAYIYHKKNHSLSNRCIICGFW